MGTAAIEGEFVDGKLSFAISFDSQNGPLQVAFSGALKDDGTLAGTLSFGEGMDDMTWHAERVKDTTR